LLAGARGPTRGPRLSRGPLVRLGGLGGARLGTPAGADRREPDNLGNSEHRARGVRRKLCLIIVQDNDRGGHALVIDPELLQPLRRREHD
jgi:hypothetical protein